MSSKKKIVFVVNTYDKRDRGGVLRVISDLANSLSSTFDVEILSIGVVHENAYPLNNNVFLKSLNINNYNTGYYRGLMKVIWFKEVYKKLKPYIDQEKIWITSSPPISMLFSFIKIFSLNIKIIACDHTSTVYKKGFLTQKLRNFMLSKLDLMIGLNPQDTTYYLKNGINSICIPNGIDLADIEHIQNNRKYLIFVGRFNEEKQPFKAVDLFIKSKLYESNIIFKMYGHGEYEEKLKKYILENKYDNYIKIITGETDPNIIYQDALALILTSKLEGFPLVLLEAMSRNIPCLCFKIPYGPINIIKEGVNGYFIEDDALDFRNKINEINLLDNSLVRLSVEQYSKKNIVKKWEKLIEFF